jgi:hypothetical protein
LIARYIEGGGEMRYSSVEDKRVKMRFYYDGVRYYMEVYKVINSNMQRHYKLVMRKQVSHAFLRELSKVAGRFLF